MCAFAVILSTKENYGGSMRTIASQPLPLITVREFSERLAIKESTARAWLLARRISRVRVGRKAVRIPASEVDRLITEGTIPAREK
jgi:excisionase family DNA binding protein